jgi:hypothetical protein
MDILSKNIMRTVAAGVAAISFSTLSSLAFAADRVPQECVDNYMQLANNAGKNITAALENCYVNRPPQAFKGIESCSQNAFQGYYTALLAAMSNYQKCAGVPRSQ